MNEELRIQDLSWKPEGKNKKILENISTVLKSGEFYGIIGPNGSGKTSLIRHIMHFLSIQEGDILLSERSLKTFSRKEFAQKLSLVPQNTNIDTDFTVYDIVSMGRNPYHRFLESNTEQDKLIIEEAMKMTGCLEMKDKSFRELSGGEAQRVIISRAIAQNTPYFILDEPIAHLDIRYQVELMKNLKEINEKKQITIIAVLHDINLAASYCKKLILMKRGKIFSEGTVEEVLTLKNLKTVYEIDFNILKNPANGKKYYIPE